MTLSFIFIDLFSSLSLGVFDAPRGRKAGGRGWYSKQGGREVDEVLVCHCNAVSDRAVRRAVRDGAMTPSDVAAACGAGSCCGGCADSVEQLIHAEARPHHANPGPETHASPSCS
jgi:bacterioferritin-associated ferredoxin